MMGQLKNMAANKKINNNGAFVANSLFLKWHEKSYVDVENLLLL